jgi:hypothetical protein
MLERKKTKSDGLPLFMLAFAKKPNEIIWGERRRR